MGTEISLIHPLSLVVEHVVVVVVVFFIVTVYLFNRYWIDCSRQTFMSFSHWLLNDHPPSPHPPKKEFLITSHNQLFNSWFTSGILIKSTVSESRKVPCDDLCGESESFTE